MPATSTRAPSALRSPVTDPPTDERADLMMLTGAPAGDLLTAVLAAEGVTLEAWATHQVHHRPGVGVTVGWTVTWRSGAVTGEEYLLGTTAGLPAEAGRRPGVTSVREGGRTVHVWRHPADPLLPGLTAASSVVEASRLLGVPTDEIVLDLVTYRPLRRAVLRARTRTGTVYLKVVRPHTAVGLHRRHELLRALGLPVAPTAVLPDGVVVMPELAGRPLTDAFAADGAVGVTPRAVVDLLGRLDGLAATAAALPHARSSAERVLDHAAAAVAVLPGRAGEIAWSARQISELVATTDPGPVVVTHGDLHAANLLCSGGAVVGLLDVDTAGPGHRVDDLACLLGHLSVLPSLAPETYRHVPAALPRWVAAFEADADPVGLRARAAAVALSLVAGATGADAEGRLGAAQRWLADAVSLRGLSSARPRRLIRDDEPQRHQGGSIMARSQDRGGRP